MRNYLIKATDGRVLAMGIIDPEVDVEDELAKSNTTYVSYVEVPEGSFPTDRTLRDSWDLDGSNNVVIDTTKAQAEIRDVRDRVLSKLDVDAFAADRAGQTSRLTDIDALAQTMRDVPDDTRFTGTDTDLKNLYTEIERDLYD